MYKELDDNKVRAMYDLIQEFKYSKQSTSTTLYVLSVLEKKGIPYLLDELPEGQSYKFYCDKLDDYLVNLIKKIK